MQAAGKRRVKREQTNQAMGSSSASHPPEASVRGATDSAGFTVGLKSLSIVRGLVSDDSAASRLPAEIWPTV